MNPRLRTRVSVPFAMALLFAGLSVRLSWAAPRGLAIRDIGTFNGSDSFGDAISNRGEVVGTDRTDAAGVAHATGKNPLQIRIDLLRPGTVLNLGDQAIDRGRMIRVLETAREKTGWATPSRTREIASAGAA